jgi:predicted porin
MKKEMRMGIACGVSLFASAVHAQSSVTLYGILDTGLLYVHNANGKSNQLGLSSGNYLGDRWGLKGKEDLGNGLSAIFTLENGFNIDNGTLGQGARMFGRQAFVGLSKNETGSLTFGRQYDPLVDLVEPLQGNWFMEYFSTPGDIDNTQNSARFNNSVKYTTPNLGGFVGSMLYSFGGVAGSISSGQGYSAAISYNQGPLGVGAGYFYFNNGEPSVSTRGTSSVDTLFYTAVNSAYSTASAVGSARIAAKYDFGVAQVGGYYSQTSYKSDGQSKFIGNENFRDYNTYALWRTSPFFFVELGYNYLWATGNSHSHYHQITIACDYFLSKHTDLYISGGYTRASGQDGAGAAQAVIGPADINAGRSTQALVMTGIKHSF